MVAPLQARPSPIHFALTQSVTIHVSFQEIRIKGILIWASRGGMRSAGRCQVPRFPWPPCQTLGGHLRASGSWATGMASCSPILLKNHLQCKVLLS